MKIKFVISLHAIWEGIREHKTFFKGPTSLFQQDTNDDIQDIREHKTVYKGPTSFGTMIH